MKCPCTEYFARVKMNAVNLFTEIAVKVTVLAFFEILQRIVINLTCYNALIGETAALNRGNGNNL